MAGTVGLAWHCSRAVLGGIINHRTVAFSVAKIVVKINFIEKYKTLQAPWGLPLARKKTTLKTTKEESCRDTHTVSKRDVEERESEKEGGRGQGVPSVSDTWGASFFTRTEKNFHTLL